MKNIEEKIKQAIEERRIQPSSSAWDHIQSEMAPAKTKQRPMAWVAAAVVCLIMAITFFILDTPKTPIAQETINSPYIEPNEKSTHTEILEVPNAELMTHTAQEKTDKVSPSNESPRPMQKTKESITLPPTQDIAIAEMPIQHPTPKETPPTTSPPMVNIPKNSMYENNALAQSNTMDSSVHKKGIRINREKLLFYIENESQLKKPKKIAFQDNNLTLDLNK